MHNISLKDSLLRDLCVEFYPAPFVIGEYRGKNMYVLKFFDYLIIRCYFDILNDRVAINEYAELNMYKEKLYVTIIEDTDDCLFIQSITYKAKPTSCFMIAKALKHFLEKYGMWNNADKVFDFKKRKIIDDQKQIKNKELTISLFDASHVAIYKQKKWGL